jgi:thiol-disulfide isomerase/thioredoxin
MLLISSLCVATAVNPVTAEQDTLTQTVQLTAVPKGASSKIGHFSPQRTEFSTVKPAGITEVPEGLTAPAYGSLGLGTGVAFILDEPDGKPAGLYVDTNRNGDLTDDAPATWKSRQSARNGTTTTMHEGSAMVDIGEPGKPLLVSISLYRFDKNDPARASQKNALLYYRDYAYEGTISLGGKSLKAMLSDEVTSGDFRGGNQEKSGAKLFLDINGNGKFDAKGESFDVRQPFNVAGTTWEITDMARDGSSFRVVKSKKTVAAVPTPPDHGKGRTITPFEAKDTAGQMVKFPNDYKGKVVLLDFWATWCGPCMDEMPNVVAAYNRYHKHGFEILGVSLDNERSIARMPDVMKKSNMTWRQIADSKGWNAEVAKKFVISSIPATLLVDGSTGQILGTNLRGGALAAAIDKALKKPEEAK